MKATQIKVKDIETAEPTMLDVFEAVFQDEKKRIEEIIKTLPNTTPEEEWTIHSYGNKIHTFDTRLAQITHRRKAIEAVKELASNEEIWFEKMPCLLSGVGHSVYTLIMGTTKYEIYATGGYTETCLFDKETSKIAFLNTIAVQVHRGVGDWSNTLYTYEKNRVAGLGLMVGGVPAFFAMKEILARKIEVPLTNERDCNPKSWDSYFDPKTNKVYQCIGRFEVHRDCEKEKTNHIYVHKDGTCIGVNGYGRPIPILEEIPLNDSTYILEGQ